MVHEYKLIEVEEAHSLRDRLDLLDQLTQKYGTEYDALLEVNELYKNIGMYDASYSPFFKRMFKLIKD